jgi:hypothetical protein
MPIAGHHHERLIGAVDAVRRERVPDVGVVPGEELVAGRRAYLVGHGSWPMSS